MAVQHGVKQYASGGKTLAYGLGPSLSQIDIAGMKGILQSATVTNDGETKTYKDNTGVTHALIRVEDYQTVSCEALLLEASRASLSKAKKAESVTLSGIDGLDSSFTFRIDSVSVAWSNEDVAKISFSVRGYTF